MGKKELIINKKQREKKMGKLSEKDEKEICGLYEGGWSMTKIASRWGVHATTIGCVLKKSKIKMRKQTPKYTYNPHAFDELTPECEYWLGILMTDGCIYKEKKSYCLQLKLSEIDKEHLEKFKTFLGSNHKLHLDKARKNCQGYTSKPLYAIHIYLQDHTLEKLSEYGIVPRKTLIANSPDDLFESRDFLRGCIDGDGSLYIHSTQNMPRIGFTSGSKRFIEKMNEKFNSIADSKTNVRKERGNKYTIRYGGKSAYKIIRFVYENAPDHIVLDRKKARAEEILKRFKDKYDN